MNSDEQNREAAYEQMMEESIKSQFEKNGTMAALRSEMHLKVLQLLRGQQNMLKPKLLTGEVTKLNKTPRDQSLIKLINQLIMEFFNWFGYRHTLETFRMETGDDLAFRSDLEERLFIIPDSKDLPLLAQLVIRDWKSSLPKKTQRPVPQNPQPKEQLEVQPIKRDVKVKKLIQNNKKLIDSDPVRKVITIKHPKAPRPPHQPPPITKKVDRKISVESSESDLLETDFSVESEDSDAYADIPDRHVFVDDLPPEGKYISGHGEEGATHDVQQNLVECLIQQYQRELTTGDKPILSQKPQTAKGKKCEKTESNVFEGLESGKKSSSNAKQEKASKKKPKVVPKIRPTLADEPETHIMGVSFDSEDFSDDEVFG
ncbi:uncharacterized protein LOC110191805 [Drosophila serrata]|uniref:uncharacterized protein LOC110191805 n=1 Tax=Drosophila serrata TaxID=7274 RepID=UPI000A1D2579|nr:uncharacterized protein LOC110191805 [Drosophila serrata]KAH8389383.1 hypothetical protein KR200_002329 [Drosophila serrata]